MAGLDADGETSLYDLEAAVDPLVLVVGSEGRGLSAWSGSPATCGSASRWPRGRVAERPVAAAAVALAEVARRRPASAISARGAGAAGMSAPHGFASAWISARPTPWPWCAGRTAAPARLVDGVPVLPSGVYLDEQGRLHVGRDAHRLAQVEPARFEPNPKRRIDEGTCCSATARSRPCTCSPPFSVRSPAPRWRRSGTCRRRC